MSDKDEHIEDKWPLNEKHVPLRGGWLTIYTYEKIEIDTQIGLCKKCNSSQVVLTISENVGSSFAGLMVMRKVVPVLRCASCNKKIRKKRWTLEIQELAEERKEAYKSSWWSRGWGLLVLCLTVIGVLAAVILYDHVKYQRYLDNMSVNYNMCHDSEIRKMWHENLAVGDVLFAYEGSEDTVRIYEVKEIRDSVFILNLYDTTASYWDLRDVEKLNKDDYVSSVFQEFIAPREAVMKGYVVDVKYNPKDEDGHRVAAYHLTRKAIGQILKKNKQDKLKPISGK